MKFFINTILCLCCVASSTLAADFNHVNPQEALVRVQSLRQSGDHYGAGLLAVESAARILRDINAGQYAKSISENFTREMEEETSLSRTENLGFSFLFGLITGGGFREYKEYEMRDKNALEYGQYMNRVRAGQEGLYGELVKYFYEHKVEIAYAKLFTVLAARSAIDANQNTREILAPHIYAIAQQTRNLMFYGKHISSVCVDKKYMDKSLRTSTELGGTLISLGYFSLVKVVGHVESSCERDTKLARLSERDATKNREVSISELSQLDTAIQIELGRLGRKELLERKSECYPTWGLTSTDSCSTNLFATPSYLEEELQ